MVADVVKKKLVIYLASSQTIWQILLDFGKFLASSPKKFRIHCINAIIGIIAGIVIIGAIAAITVMMEIVELQLFVVEVQLYMLQMQLFTTDLVLIDLLSLFCLYFSFGEFANNF